jgi:3',5'-cyclic AMP phosphodiesterase CpdA
MKFIYSILAVLWAISAYSGQPVLRFKNHKFKIVQFTDLHLISGKEFAQRNDSTYMLMRCVIKEENPDFVVLTGDIVVSGGAAQVWEEVVKPMTEAQVPFAVTFGNHDTETDLSKASTLKLIQKNKFNLTYNADKKLSGVGNCSLPILSSEGKSMPWAIYLFDSHAYTKDTVMGTYDWIKNDQIQWYRKQSAAYTAKQEKTVSALAFFHIPLPEYEYVRNKKSTLGSIEESVCSPSINSGLFSSFIEMGDVMGVFVGHDHNDDYVGTAANICLGYGRKTGYASAYHEILERGARVIELYENEKKFDTHIRTLSRTCLEYSFLRK